MTFYDLTGRAVAYIDDGENIYLYSGEPVAYLFGNLIYNYRGFFLGRFEDGWVRDNSGCCVFFTENANGGGPVKPIRQIKPVKGVKRVRPMKGVRHVPSIPAVNKLVWSNLSGERFFMQ